MKTSFLKVTMDVIRDARYGVTDDDLVQLVKLCVECLADRRKLKKMNEAVVEAMAYEDCPVD